jgi:hypothetical protein
MKQKDKKVVLGERLGERRVGKRIGEKVADESECLPSKDSHFLDITYQKMKDHRIRYMVKSTPITATVLTIL